LAVRPPTTMRYRTVFGGWRGLLLSRSVNSKWCHYL